MPASWGEAETRHGLGDSSALSFGRDMIAEHARQVRGLELGDQGIHVVRTAGEYCTEHASGLVAALEEASAAASGMSAVLASAVPGGLMSGPALTECAALLARRASDCATETDRLAADMPRIAEGLVAADEEVARRVSRVAG